MIQSFEQLEKLVEGRSELGSHFLAANLVNNFDAMDR